MIHFFRKIRNQLLYENRFKKYLLYALGEIFLVMIGILLALQFNNWNIEKENNIKEEWYLINMVEDIEYQKTDLKNLAAYYKEAIAVGKSIILDYKKLKSFTEIDSLNSKLNLLLTVDNFPNVNNTYQELVSSGQQSLIKNKDLSITIIDYYLLCNSSYLDIKSNNDNVYYKQVCPTLYNLSQTSLAATNIYDDELMLLENDDISTTILNTELEKPANILQLLNAIKTQIIIHTNHLEMVEDILAFGKEVIIEIDKELGLTSEMVNNFD